MHFWLWAIFISEWVNIILCKLFTWNRPCGKESTEVQITQNMGKERENSYQKIKRSPEERHTQKLIRNILIFSDVFLNQKRVILSWLRKTSVIVEIFLISFCVFLCDFPSEISSFFGKNFPFPFPYFQFRWKYCFKTKGNSWLQQIY